MAFTSSQKELISSMFQNLEFKEKILRGQNGDMIRSSVVCSGKVCDFHITSDSDSQNTYFNCDPHRQTTDNFEDFSLALKKFAEIADTDENTYSAFDRKYSKEMEMLCKTVHEEYKEYLLPLALKSSSHEETKYTCPKCSSKLKLVIDRDYKVFLNLMCTTNKCFDDLGKLSFTESVDDYVE